MTIREIIDTVDIYRPKSEASESMMIRWIQDLDRKAVDSVMNACEDAPGYPTYCDESLTESPLIDSPYDSIYVEYLKSMVDELHGDTERYDVSAALFNSKWEEWSAYYLRTHRGKQTRTVYY